MSDRTLKTKIKTPAKIDKMVSFWALSKMALKMLVNSEMSVKISKMWMVYHYTPTKLPKIVAITNIKMDKNPD